MIAGSCRQQGAAAETDAFFISFHFPGAAATQHSLDTKKVVFLRLPSTNWIVSYNAG